MNNKIESYINLSYELCDIPGIAVALKARDFYYSGAKGYKNMKNKEVLNVDDVFHCTSLSKLFTASAIMILAKNGRIGLDERVKKILPYIAIADRRFEDVTIKHLLSHTSGLGDVSEYGWECCNSAPEALREYMKSEEMFKMTMYGGPEEKRFIYSNVGYDILGAVIEEVSDMPFEDFIDEEIFKSLSMQNSMFCTVKRTGGGLGLDDVQKAGLVMPHRKMKDRSIELEEVYPYTREHGPSSTLTSTVDDLLKFAKAFMDESRKEGFLPWQRCAVVPDTGEGMSLGWFLREYVAKDGKKYTLIGHEGADRGFRSSLFVCPEVDFATVLLSNISNAPLKRTGTGLFETVLKNL